MARITYNASTPFGQLTAEAIDGLQSSTDKIIRTASAVTMMTPEECELEVGVPQDEYANFRNRLNDLETYLQDESFQEKLTMLDQG